MWGACRPVTLAAFWEARGGIAFVRLCAPAGLDLDGVGPAANDSDEHMDPAEDIPCAGLVFCGDRGRETSPEGSPRVAPTKKGSHDLCRNSLFFLVGRRRFELRTN